jgi:hypothetical protein
VICRQSSAPREAVAEEAGGTGAIVAAWLQGVAHAGRGRRITLAKHAWTIIDACCACGRRVIDYRLAAHADAVAAHDHHSYARRDASRDADDAGNVCRAGDGAACIRCARSGFQVEYHLHASLM